MLSSITDLHVDEKKRKRKEQEASRGRRTGEVMNSGVGVVSLRVKMAMIMRQEQLGEQKKVILEASKAKIALKMTRKNAYNRIMTYV